jgi:hypothetical protein
MIYICFSVIGAATSCLQLQISAKRLPAGHIQFDRQISENLTNEQEGEVVFFNIFYHHKVLNFSLSINEIHLMTS